jgi:hypothetical protein
MTLCVIDGGHCVCQPDEGVPCVPALNMKAEIDRLRGALTEIAHRPILRREERIYGIARKIAWAALQVPNV